MTSYRAIQSLRPRDLVAFRFPYVEGCSPYARPCLVLEATTAEVLLAYGTTSRGRANQGFEIRVNQDFAACGLLKPTRFVTARRLRVFHTDSRFEAQSELGVPLLGTLPDSLNARMSGLLDRLCADYATPELRYRAERAGIHPRKGGRRHRRWRGSAPLGACGPHLPAI